MDLKQLAAEFNPWWRLPESRAAREYKHKRDAYARILNQIQKLDDRRGVVLVGPRQVGKTTLIRQVIDRLLDTDWPAANVMYFDFSDDRLTESVSARDVATIEPLGIDPRLPRAFFFDEVAGAGNWASWLKAQIDAGEHRFVVTDSAAAVLAQAGQESGQGRWDEVVLEGLSFGEFARLNALANESIDEALRRVPNLLERYLVVGGFPEHALSDGLEEVRRRLRIDIADRAILRDLLRFGVDVEQVRRLFVYLVEDSGAILDAATRGRLIGADPRSVREWVRLLKSTLLIVELGRHAGSASARLRSQPRLYAADHGLVSAFSTASPLQDEGVRSRIFEAAVFRHLRCMPAEDTTGLSFFRRNDDREVDFVVTRRASAIASIEVTSNQSPGPRKVGRLREANRQIGASRSILVHGGFVDEMRESVRLVPLQRFLLDTRRIVLGDS